MNVFLGLALIILAIGHVLYWKHYRPKTFFSNLERAIHTGTVIGLGMSCVTGAWVALLWQVWIFLFLLLIVYHLVRIVVIKCL